MFSYDRNVDLEEVRVSPLFELDLIRYSSKAQLLLIAGSVISSVILVIINSLFIHMDSYLATIVLSLPVCIGALFGCQYNQDLSYYDYIKCLIKNPKKTFYKKSTEDILSSKETITMFLEEKSAEKEALQKKKKKQNKIILISSIFAFLVLVIVFMYISTRPTVEPYHYEKTVEQSGNGNEEK